ncbi:FtsK/SpoIIIE domain-containing protein [Microbacterium sp. bgisy203]|uniref:FtsK/SpoIIIE domain-containing protein n=1 Tax=Microbacterium sp. bgisy203 TaxID=3413799 RepID=UPI003D72C3D9
MHDAHDDPLRLPAPPPSPPRPALPIAAAIVPVIGAVVLWKVTGSPFALWFAALGPLMAGASFLDGLRTARRTKRRAAKDGARELGVLEGELDRRHDVERERAWRRTPDVAGYAAAPEEIWRVVPGREDVLVVGAGRAASGVRLDGEAHDDRSRALRRRSRMLDDVPITVPLAGGVAVAGPAIPAAAVVRALALQVCLAHAPGSVRLGDAGAAAAGDATLRVPHAEATRGALLVVANGGRPVSDGIDIPIVQVREGDPPPPRCAAVLTLTGADRARLDHDGLSQEVRVEAISSAQAEALAAALAARADSLGQRVDGAVSLEDLPVLGGGRGSLAAAVGRSGGAPVVLDLVGDGPHAVVIGVTGSGKSELLTTWIAAMCRTRSPQELSLLLVDFKGGRTFDALAALPHVTGVLTDLDEARALRAVESLTAEIRYRERVLADADARDIDDAGDALSRLVIVVDEYAALVAARPELHDLFADIAARGRALGMHLILASQRAAGAFRDGVLANAPLRIAFRVTDGADSRTVIGQDDAVRLPGSEAARGTALIRCAADATARTVRVARTGADALAELRAQASGHAPARRPWLPPLPDRLELHDVRRSGEIVLGLSDEPEHQRQSVVTLPRAAGGLAIVGGPGSGRSTLLATIAAQAERVLRVPADAEGAWDALDGIAAAPAGTVVLVDDADALVGRLPGEYAATWVAGLERAAREARGRGIVLVVAVARLAGGLGRVLELLPHRLLLPLPTRTDHVAAGGESSDFAAGTAPGRGRWGRRPIQVAVADGPGGTGGVGAGGGAGGLPGSLPASMATLEPTTPLAIVTPPGARVERLRAACAEAGLHAMTVEEAAASTTPPSRGDAVIGTPDAWLAQWRVLAAAREHSRFVVDVACASEYRAVTGRRESPPYTEAVPGRAWALAPGEAPARVWLPD